MTIHIRPPAEDELRAAMTASEVAFGSGELKDEDWERERKALPGVACARRLRRAASRSRSPAPTSST